MSTHRVEMVQSCSIGDRHGGLPESLVITPGLGRGGVLQTTPLDHKRGDALSGSTSVPAPSFHELRRTVRCSPAGKRHGEFSATRQPEWARVSATRQAGRVPGGNGELGRARAEGPRGHQDLEWLLPRVGREGGAADPRRPPMSSSPQRRRGTGCLHGEAPQGSAWGTRGCYGDMSGSACARYVGTLPVLRGRACGSRG